MPSPIYPLTFPYSVEEALYEMPEHMLDTPPGFHKENGLLAMAYGAGVDSTGILAYWYESGKQKTDPIHIIAFGDTGTEGPWVYEHVQKMQVWLKEHGFPPITILTKGGRIETLEENCLRMAMLPSLAYGFKGCSQKYKIEPQDKFYNNLPAAREVWASGQLVRKLIGYEAREVKRWKKAKKFDDKYEYEFPLVEIGWNREQCIAAIQRVGMPMPGKSACFICPASTLPEIRKLRDEHPDLFARALEVEARFLAQPFRECPTCKGKGYVLDKKTQVFVGDPEKDAAPYLHFVENNLPFSFGEDGMMYAQVIGLFPCVCDDCKGTGRRLKTVKGLGRRFAWKDVDVIDQDMQPVAAVEVCRSCVDYAIDEDDDPTAGGLL